VIRLRKLYCPRRKALNGTTERFLNPLDQNRLLHQVRGDLSLTEHLETCLLRT